MDAQQRSELNNQTDNGANEKGTPGATPPAGAGTGMPQPDPKDAARRATSPGTEAGVPGAQYGDTPGNRQGADDNRADLVDASNSEIQRSTDREAAQAGTEPREQGVQDIHQSNDVAGGLPRSPGGSGPRTEGEGYQTGGSMSAEPNPVHESNDAAGGYPRSPGGANKLAGDRKMDDDTGFSRG